MTYTRKQYLNGACTHEQYYLGIAEAAGLSFNNHPMLGRVRAALGAGDQDLNKIPLVTWDRIAAAFNTEVLREAMRARGDYVTQAGLACLAKAMRELAKLLDEGYCECQDGTILDPEGTE